MSFLPCPFLFLSPIFVPFSDFKYSNLLLISWFFVLLQKNNVHIRNRLGNYTYLYLTFELRALPVFASYRLDFERMVSREIAIMLDEILSKILMDRNCSHKDRSTYDLDSMMSTLLKNFRRKDKCRIVTNRPLTSHLIKSELQDFVESQTFGATEIMV